MFSAPLLHRSAKNTGYAGVGYTIMRQKNKKSLLSKILYWMISVFIIIFLFFIIFGVLPMIIEHTKLNPTSVIGLIIGAIGATIIIISLYCY